MFKYSFLSFFILLFSFQPINAQESEKTVYITVSGSGKTQDEAKQSALRSAIEQAFGAFISSKTEILNDQVVADQMASVASGNIQSFKVLNESQLPDGSWANTIKAIVSVSKLTSFVEAKGIAVEIKGGLFAINIKQQMLNELGEFKSVCELVGLLHEPMQTAFDYTIKSNNPKSLDAENKKWEIPIEVKSTTNKNFEFCASYFIKTLASISLSSEEVETYSKLNKSVYPILINYKNENLTFYLRKYKSILALNTFVSQWKFYCRLFKFQKKKDDWSIFEGKGDFHYLVNRDDPKLVVSGGLNPNYNYYEPYLKRLNINFLTLGEEAASFTWKENYDLKEIENLTGFKVVPLGVVSKFKNGGFVVYVVPAYYRIGLELDSLTTKAVVKKLFPGEVAEKSGMLPGDEIITINDIPVTNNEMSFIYSNDTKSKEYEFQIKRAENIIKLRIIPGLIPTSGLVAAVCDLGPMDWDNAKIACEELEVNGYSDWRLPSKDDLNKIYLKFRKSSKNNRVVDYGGFFNDEYWSSEKEITKNNEENAIYFKFWYQDFEVYQGEVSGFGKYSRNDRKLMFRPVRSF